jgi:dTDP-4-dehydrorhamnose 3,5-epimerase
MEITPLEIDGAWVAQFPVWSDDRGSFREWFKYSEIEEKTGINFEVKQANISFSHRGVIRGIHYSLSAEGQAKWVTCVRGSINDVIVDIRPTSATFGKHVSINLTGSDGLAVLIGKGLGHGFISLENETAVSYLLSSPYSPADELEINPFDPFLDIRWAFDDSVDMPIRMSTKDSTAPGLLERKNSDLLPK